ncbi:MAG: glucose-1-phosphate adenylyltransferase [Rhodothermales bacterium]
MNETIAVILGGGAGSRLHPLTHRRSKPAVPLAGRFRLIDIPISNCINSGINRIFVLTQFNSASLHSHIQNAYRFDRFDRGFVTIQAAEQTPMSTSWFQGTADAVRRIQMHTRVSRHSHVLILSGDQLYTMDYRLMLKHHEDHGADITIASIPVHANDAPGFGILKTDDKHRITEFYEKPKPYDLAGKESPVDDDMRDAGRVFLASMGIYIFNKDVLRDLLAEDESRHDFGRELIPTAIKKRNVVSYPFKGYWSDIGTIKSFYDANIMLTAPKPEFDVYDPNAPLYTEVRTLPHAKITNAVIRNSIIAEASVIIDSDISDSVIGIRSHIGRGTTIRRSVIMGADYFHWHDSSEREHLEGPDRPGIGDETFIEGAIVDKNVSIGARCVIANRAGIEEGGDDATFYIKDGIVVIPKNVRIPDGTVI